MTVAIQCLDVKKSYGTGENVVEALKSTSLEVETGQLTLLVGPSGSGKTTLISIMATILTPDAGELVLLDQNMKGKTDNEKALFRSKNIGMVFQSLYLIPTLTIAENISLPLVISGMSEKKAMEESMKLLEKVHLSHRSNVSPSALSKGQQQKIAIARAMVNGGSIIICDEPTSALDHTAGFEIMEFLHTLAQDPTKAVVVVTHDPRIFKYADRVIQMCDGEIVSEGI
jgi:putative ABC transport system ATP-binding protein